MLFGCSAMCTSACDMGKHTRMNAHSICLFGRIVSSSRRGCCKGSGQWAFPF